MSDQAPLSSETKSEPGISVLELIRDNKRFLLAFTLCCTVSSGVYSFFMRHTYQATAKFMATETKTSPLGAMLGGIPAIFGGAAGGSTSALSMGEILNSRTNTEFVIKSCGIDQLRAYAGVPQDELVMVLNEQLNVDAKRTSGVIMLEGSLQTGWFPSSEEQRYVAELCAKMCNTAIEGLDKANREKSTSTARKTRKYIERVLAANRTKLDTLQKTMVSYQTEHHIFTPEKQAEAMVASGVSIGTELAKAETELRLAREQYQANTPMIGALQAKVDDLRTRYLSVQNGGLTSSDHLSIPVNVLPSVSMGYLNLVRDIKILEQVNAYLESQRMQEAIQEERDVPTIQVIDPAVAVYKRVSPARTLMLLVSAVVSSLLGVVLLILARAYKGFRTHI